jgi:Protein of unknown function (DUF4235)
VDEDDVVVSVVATVVTLGAGLAAKKLFGAIWARWRGVVPGDADADVTWREAAVFALVSGAVVGAARLVAQRAVVLSLAERTGRKTAEEHAPTA